jgi:hypothetical protein
LSSDRTVAMRSDELRGTHSLGRELNDAIAVAAPMAQLDVPAPTALVRIGEGSAPVMNHLSPRRLVSLGVTLAILAIPTLVAALTAAPQCPSCMR